MNKRHTQSFLAELLRVCYGASNDSLPTASSLNNLDLITKSSLDIFVHGLRYHLVFSSEGVLSLNVT